MNPEQYLNPERSQIKALMTHGYSGAVLMLNLLKYKPIVDGISGKEKYREYMHAAQPFMEKVGGVVTFYGNPMATVIGPDKNEWDKVMIVRYESKEDFLRMTKLEGYPHHLRTAALLDSRLICMEDHE